VAIDMSVPQGQQLVRRLAGRSDILIENYKVGGMKKFGGQDGPYAERPGGSPG
jgi:crotonobetainyl-CoA:carnitine CoA-transferase CaiB-like acyl-CoA transferase